MSRPRKSEQFPWTPENVETLRHLKFDKGWTATPIARALGTTRCTVLGKINRLWGRTAPQRHRVDQRYIQQKLAQVRLPKDTRDLTARILGDPLPGRSALDQSRGLQS